jgi:hypothetical protein
VPVAVGADGGLPGTLVYIEKVVVGRVLPGEGKPSSVGGVVVRRGCALAPPVQIVTPLPAPLTLHGGARAAQLRITAPDGAAKAYELEPAGRLALLAQLGVTRIDSADGAIASAWVVAVDAPYYALTDDHGRFRLDELAAGYYEVTIWHAPVPALVKGALAYGPPLVVRRTVRVEGARAARLDVTLGM